MKRVYAAEAPWMMNYIMTILKQEHIDCIQKNVALAGAIGELPVCCSEIWVTVDEDYDRANAVIADLCTEPITARQGWRCQCGENIEPQFSECWHCGSTVPDSTMDGQ